MGSYSSRRSSRWGKTLLRKLVSGAARAILRHGAVSIKIDVNLVKKSLIMIINNYRMIVDGILFNVTRIGSPHVMVNTKHFNIKLNSLKSIRIKTGTKKIKIKT